MKDLFSLNGKVAVVTGGSGHLGSAMVQGLLEFGARVIVADAIEKIPEHFTTDKKLQKNLMCISCDLSKTSDIKEMFNKAKEIFGGINILVNCAAYGGGSGGKGAVGGILDTTDELWQEGIDGTAGVTFRCIREVVPYLVESGGGSIVNIASMYGVVSPDPRIYGTSGQGSPISYGAGKAAVLQITKYCAAHLSDMNINVNSITPGPFPNVDNMANGEGNPFLQVLSSKAMVGRVGKSIELVGAVLFLASGASSYMTGSNITVDGGWTAW